MLGSIRNGGVMNTSYELCKKCVIDSLGWNDIAEAWATKGCVLSGYRPIIQCPSPIKDKYIVSVEKEVWKFINKKFKNIDEIKIYDDDWNQNLSFLGRDVPQWCPYYRSEK